jgi:hypothetical protein
MIKKLIQKQPALVVIMMLFSQPVSADDDNPYGAAIEKYFEKTYVTFGGGSDSKNNLNSGDIYYEAQIYAHLNWLNYSSDGISPSNIFRIYVPVRVQVRQFKTDSSPVKTPSYNPGIRFFYANKSWVESAENFHYVSLGLHHYSNGQRGPHIDPVTNAINTETGSFSTDYADLSYYYVDKSKHFEWAKINYRYYFVNATWEADQTGFFEDRMLEISGWMSLFENNGNSDGYFRSAALKLTVARKIGRTFVTPGDRASSGDNMQYKGELFIQPASWHDISIYLRWDKGYDYYNINYAKEMNRIHFGISADL